jgi:hypothetical protein
MRAAQWVKVAVVAADAEAPVAAAVVVAVVAVVAVAVAADVVVTAAVVAVATAVAAAEIGSRNRTAAHKRALVSRLNCVKFPLIDCFVMPGCTGACVEFLRA